MKIVKNLNMKKILIIILLSLGAVQATSIFIPKLKPAKEEIEVRYLPEVIVNGTSTGKRGYSTSFTVELGEYCPRNNPNYKEEQENYEINNAEGAMVYAKHCIKCRSGVYFKHEDESVRRCSYCEAKEE